MIRIKIKEVVESAIKLFSGTGRPGEGFTSRKFFQHYGFTSRPLDGAEGIAMRQGNAVVMIATEDRRYRIAIEEGEVAIYTHEGSKIHLKNNGVIEVNAETEVTVNAQTVNLGEKTTVAGVVTRQCICAFTGGPHPDASIRVKAAKT